MTSVVGRDARDKVKPITIWARFRRWLSRVVG